MIHEIRKLEKKDRGALYCVGLVYAGLGDNDQVFAWLTKGAEAMAPTQLMENMAG